MEKLKKELGQNFLINQDDINNFINFCDINNNDIVLEIGPGNGALTKHIAQKAGKVIGIELDTTLIPILNNLKIKNLKIKNCNFLDLNLRKLIEEEKITKIIGAIPYYITSPIIHKIVEESYTPLLKVCLITQKEFAQKVIGTNKKEHPSRSYFTNLIEKYATINAGKTIVKNSFNPAPKVNSMFFGFTFKNYPKNILEVKNWEKFLHVVFKNPRKKINKAFRANILTTHNINSDLRPSNLTLESIIALYKEYYK